MKRPRITFCRCCGRSVAIERVLPLWCVDCRQHIIDGDRLRPDERTYAAQHGHVCPFTLFEPEPEAEAVAVGGGE